MIKKLKHSRILSNNTIKCDPNLSLTIHFGIEKCALVSPIKTEIYIYPFHQNLSTLQETDTEFVLDLVSYEDSNHQMTFDKNDNFVQFNASMDCGLDLLTSSINKLQVDDYEQISRYELVSNSRIYFLIVPFLKSSTIFIPKKSNLPKPTKNSRNLIESDISNLENIGNMF